MMVEYAPYPSFALAEAEQRGFLMGIAVETRCDTGE